MNTKQLRYFVAIAESGSFNRAAERLYIAQPAIGLQIRLLEEQLGVQLFVRHSRGVTLTPAGSKLYKYAMQIMQLIADAEQDIKNGASDQPRRVGVGLTPSIMNVLGAHLVIEASSRVQGFDIYIEERVSRELSQSVEKGELDFAVGYELETGSLRKKVLAREELAFVASPYIVIGRPSTIEWNEAIKFPLLVSDGNDPVRKIIDEVAAAEQTPANYRFEASSNNVRIKLMTMCKAVSIMPALSVYDQIVAGELTALKLSGESMFRDITMVSNPKSTSEAEFEAIYDEARSLLMAKAGVIEGFLHF